MALFYPDYQGFIVVLPRKMMKARISPGTMETDRDSK